MVKFYQFVLKISSGNEIMTDGQTYGMTDGMCVSDYMKFQKGTVDTGASPVFTVCHKVISL